MDIKWIFSDDIPIYLQIVEQIKKLIISGKLSPGDKLPTVRDIASDAEVNPNTVQRALSELEREGLVYAQRTSGRFITDDKELIQKEKDSFARKKISAFLQNMKETGFSQDILSEMIKNYKEAEL